ncbi:hypothetical protein N9023_01055 [Opitutaceae bacterium]|nr:hypothetical protein [Opitutaceae bacterium]MDB4473568.1 hypothetical protein [Opitutaceae bacterium]
MLSRCAVIPLFLLAAIVGHAQKGPTVSTMAAVEVEDVSFQRVRDSAGETWWEAAVEVRVSPRNGAVGKFAHRVQITFNLAHQSAADTTDLQFYRASVTTAVLETGRATFRFYLPPAVVARDRLSGDARFWTVDLSIDGQAQPHNREQVAAGFSSAAAVANFRQQLSERAPANDGILLPWHLVPADRLPGSDPIAIRREAIENRR